MRNAHGYVVKMPGTNRYMALLAQALVCNFYLLRTFIIWSNEVQLLKGD